MLRAKEADLFIADWLRNRRTAEFLGIWKSVHNPDFNYGGFATIRSLAGQRIRIEVLRKKRAAYGEQIVASVGRQLSAEYGSGFADKNLRRIVQFAEVFSEEQIVVSLIRQLSWTHFLALLPLKHPLQEVANLKSQNGEG